MSIAFFEYLDGPYLLYPYLTGFALANYQGQFTQQIADDRAVRTQQLQHIETSSDYQTQFNQRIDSGSKLIYAQFERKITDDFSARSQFEGRLEKETNIRSQFDRRIDADVNVLSQFDRRVEDDFAINSQFDRKNSEETSIPSQFEGRIDADLNVFTQYDQNIVEYNNINQQFNRRITANPSIRGQFNRQIYNGLKSTRSEFTRGPVSHEICGGYLLDEYLEMPYLATEICAHLRAQYEVINALKLNTQVTFSIYNTKLLRILCDFPSRGTSGTNWSVIAGGTAVGDFSINNVNTDIVEQVYRATAKSATIQCDTQIPQGIFNDTLAILGHNFTRSAQVTMLGSNDPTFVTVGLTEVLDVELDNIYWISEYLPLSSYRYWRFVISDPTNANNLQIGTIVFGPSIIFNGECFIDDVVRRKIHFADRVRTEGYTSVSNDRALKRAVSLSFRRLDFNRDNYEHLAGVIDSARTSLKCLWIPTPEYPSRFAVFGKLSEIPVENHKVIGENADYIDIDITVDESL